jgi:hypothetical protein
MSETTTETGSGLQLRRGPRHRCWRCAPGTSCELTPQSVQDRDLVVDEENGRGIVMRTRRQTMGKVQRVLLGIDLVTRRNCSRPVLSSRSGPASSRAGRPLSMTPIENARSTRSRPRSRTFSTSEEGSVPAIVRSSTCVRTTSRPRAARTDGRRCGPGRRADRSLVRRPGQRRTPGRLRHGDGLGGGSPSCADGQPLAGRRVRRAAVRLGRLWAARVHHLHHPCSSAAESRRGRGAAHRAGR